MTSPIVPLPVEGDQSWMDWAGMVHDHVTAADTGISEVNYDNVPPGTVFVLPKTAAGTWPSRPSNRTDIVFDWTGADPPPPIVAPPSVSGAYARNISGGVHGDRNSLA